MTLNRDASIEKLIRQRLAYQKAKNHNVYDKRLIEKPPVPGFEKKPRCIYFYYVRIDEDGKVRVDHYFYVNRDEKGKSQPIKHADVPKILETLAINGRPRKEKDPPKLPMHNFDPIPWQYRNYIAIFLDEANWSFVKRKNGDGAIVFDPVKGTPNNSFFDAADVILKLPPKYDERTAVYFVNHMKKNEQGEGLGKGKKQKFKFDMWLEAKFAETSTTGMRVNFDPGGTNQGPPGDPP